MLNDRRILLIVSGSVAAYKALDLTRLLRKAGASVTAVLTAGGARFVTKEALAGITGQRVHDDLWAAEAEIGHIRLARLPDLVVVAPASADLLAKMANGLADDLASTVLLATRAPILVAPAMNPAMWDHPATRANLAALAARGVQVVGPGVGAMAEPESGPGRLSEPAEILAAIEALLSPAGRPLAERHALVTAGPTHEPIDPVRYIANRSSGKQGYAIAAALAALGARVTLVSGPVALPDPRGVAVVRVEFGARDAGRLRGGAAGRHRRHGRRRRRLAGGAGGDAEAEEGARRRGADPRDGAEPRHPGDPVPPCPAPRPGRGLRRRDRIRRRARHREAAAQGLRLDRRQRCLRRCHGRRPQHRPPGHRGGRRGLAGTAEGRGRRAAGGADRREPWLDRPRA